MSPCSARVTHFRAVRGQMPNARAHALGNANVVKADVLFGFLRDCVLPNRIHESRGGGPVNGQGSGVR